MEGEPAIELETPKEDPAPKVEPAAEGDAGPAPNELAFTQLGGADWNDPTTPYKEAKTSILKIHPDQVEEWTAALRKERVAVVRGLDTRVLLAAEHAIANAAPFATGFERCLVGRDSMGLPGARIAKDGPTQSRRTFPDLSTLWDERFGRRPRLFIVRAYGAETAYDWMEQLPFFSSDFDDLVQNLSAHDRYLFVLTKPEHVDFREERSEMSMFLHTADFLYPRLEAMGPDGLRILDQLRRQYCAGMWTKSADDHRLDEDFWKQVLSDIDSGKLVEIVRCGEEMQKIPDGGHTSLRQLFQAEADKIRFVERPGRRQDESALIEQVILFTSAHLNDLPAEDFDSVVRQLLGDTTVRRAKPVRGLRKDKVVTQIRAFMDEKLVDIWSRERHALALKCRLRCLVIQGHPVLNRVDAEDQRKSFSTHYPFTYVELWQRAVETGLLFHSSDAVAAKWIAVVVERLGNSPQDARLELLVSLLLADNALGRLAGDDLGERFDALPAPRRFLVLSRLADLLKEMAQNDLLDLVDALLEGLVASQAPQTAQKLLQQLDGIRKLPLENRLRLVRSVLSHARREHWESACTLLKRWAFDPTETQAVMRWIGVWMKDGATTDTGPLVAVSAVIVPIALRWATNTGANHGVIEFLRVAGRAGVASADMLPMLVRWLFHPAFEAACVEDRFKAISASWLLPRRSGILRSDQATLKEMRDVAYSVLAGEFAGESDVTDTNTPSVLAIRECQAVLLADWLDGLDRSDEGAAGRALLTAALAERLTPRARREFFVTLSGLASAADWLKTTGRNHEWTALSFDEESECLVRRQQAIRALNEIVRAAAASLTAPLA